MIAALSGAPQTDPFAALRAEAGKPGATVSIEACPRPLPVDEIEGVSLVCGRVKIPEERTKRDSKMLSLAFFILKAHSRFPESDPVVYLQGGPGDSALRLIPLLARAFAPLRGRRDIVAFDQRSAGFSGLSASCATMVSANSYDILRRDDGTKNLPAMTKECVAELQRLGVPRLVYNTTANALYVPLIVRALGYAWRGALPALRRRDGRRIHRQSPAQIRQRLRREHQDRLAHRALGE